ncbi:MAG: hypothetical protein R2747_00115 [Pyrinomonadaceae bacterium]
MKRKFFLIFLIGSIFVFNTMAQTKDQTQPAIPAADPADVASIDAIIKAVYDVISGDAGKKRDWNRFRSLFHKDARLIPSGKNPQTGITGATAISPDGYIERSGPYLEKNGFFEKEISRKTDVFGNIAQVFSTYASFHKADDKEPFQRGINSFQLLNDGKRWWVITIYWQGETKDSPIPKEYL